MKKKGIAAVVIAAAACAAAALIWHQTRHGSADSAENIAYVQTVAEWMGTDSGMVNKFAGVVESQNTWSASLNPDSTIKETYVSVGDEVKEGDPLFEYDVEKYKTDLAQAEIDLERMNNELDAMDTTISSLEKEKKKASSSEQADYTIRIGEARLQKKQKELDVTSKQMDIDKLNENIENATVKSGLDGIVKSVGTGDSSYGSTDDSAYVTIMETGEVQIKGSVNEQNIGELTEGQSVIVHSRVDDTRTWKGTITRIDRENKETDNSGYYAGGDDAAMSSSYPFYVTLDTSDDLMLGQHVYVEPDFGQEDTEEDGIWLEEYLIDDPGGDTPFVWADDGGRLTKKSITLGRYDENLGRYLVTGGLAETEAIAVPDDTLSEGMKTAPMSEQIYDTAEEASDGEGEVLYEDGMEGETGGTDPETAEDGGEEAAA